MQASQPGSRAFLGGARPGRWDGLARRVRLPGARAAGWRPRDVAAPGQAGRHEDGGRPTVGPALRPGSVARQVRRLRPRGRFSERPESGATADPGVPVLHQMIRNAWRSTMTLEDPPCPCEVEFERVAFDIDGPVNPVGRTARRAFRRLPAGQTARSALRRVPAERHEACLGPAAVDSATGGL